MQQLKIWGRWKSNRVAEHYMRKSKVTKLANANFLDLNRNNQSHFDILQPQDLPPIIDASATSTTTGKATKRRRDKDDDNGDMEPKKKKRKKSKKKKGKRRDKEIKKVKKKINDLLKQIAVLQDDSDSDSES